MSAVDDLSYPLACDDRTRDAVNTIVSGRKSWKTLKGKGEAVWPPYLEAALIEGTPTLPLSYYPSPTYLLAPLFSSSSPRQVPSRDISFDPLFEQVPESQSLYL
jgi:transcriptional enhancer factor